MILGMFCVSQSCPGLRERRVYAFGANRLYSSKIKLSREGRENLMRTRRIEFTIDSFQSSPHPMGCPHCC